MPQNTTQQIPSQQIVNQPHVNQPLPNQQSLNQPLPNQPYVNQPTIHTNGHPSENPNTHPGTNPSSGHVNKNHQHGGNVIDNKPSHKTKHIAPPGQFHIHHIHHK